MKMKKLNDVMPVSSGIFSRLQSLDVPWRELNIAGLLDVEYLYNVAGDRFISPLVLKILSDSEMLNDVQLQQLAEMIFALCSVRWGKLWNTLSFEYNPIENYSMVETMTGDRTEITYGKTDTRTPNITENRTPDITTTVTPNTTETRTPNTTETRTPETTETVNTDAQGFNSSSFVPTDKQTTINTGTETITVSGSETVAKTGTETTTEAGTEARTTTGTDTTRQSGSDTHERNYTLTRSGNIGVTTSQQMIESERELWNWQFFYDVVFPDLNRVLTLSIY